MLSPSAKSAAQTAIASATSILPLNSLLKQLTLHGLIPEAIWSRLPVNGTFIVALDDGITFKYTAVPQDAIGRRLAWRGIQGYEPETIAVFQRLARTARVILDIGANTGLYTLVAASVNSRARVLAFEPVPENYHLLLTNIALNHVDDRCTAYQLAVSDRPGIQRFHVPFGGVPHSGSLNPQGFKGLAGTLIEVNTSSVDQLCSDIDGIDLVKVDVEGFESNVFDGMNNVMEKHHPAIIFECIVSAQLDHLQDLLTSHGYTFYRISDNGLVNERTLRSIANTTSRNVLCVPEDTKLPDLLSRSGMTLQSDGN